MIREYADDTLRGTVSNIEDSKIGVGINVYKNGERIKYVSLGTFDASGQSNNVDVFDLPEIVIWYVRDSRVHRPHDPLEIPWYGCDWRVYRWCARRNRIHNILEMPLQQIPINQQRLPIGHKLPNQGFI